ncbi:formylglycine-generating enzyme family protein [Candidatus Poribacteria bacterium]|nr:formylglycine-generating enzyme family protein [Candidatus Poribacteria bacterium]
MKHSSTRQVLRKIAVSVPGGSLLLSAIIAAMLLWVSSASTQTPGIPDKPASAPATPLPVFPERTIMLPGNIPLVLVRVPAGQFEMGTKAGTDPAWTASAEQPAHVVTIPREFFIGKYEITQGQWMALMGSNPAKFTGDISRPVERVSWVDVHIFLTALNNHIASTNQGSANLRIPSEAEWEYAARAGSTTRFFFGDSTCGPLDRNMCDLADHGWFCSNSGDQSHPVGADGHANAWGIYDMHGNVSEWCEDWWHDNYNGAPADGTAWVQPAGSFRVLRGGAWNSVAGFCRSAYRGRSPPGNQFSNIIGFRVAAGA